MLMIELWGGAATLPVNERASAQRLLRHFVDRVPQTSEMFIL